MGKRHRTNLAGKHPAQRALNVQPHEALVKSYQHEWLHNERLLSPLLQYNIAHLIMLSEQNIVPRKAAALLVHALLDLSKTGFSTLPFDPKLDGLQPNVEAEMARRCGPDVAGWLNTGRARQECELVARQILERDQIVIFISKNLDLRQVLLDLAEREVKTVMPYYTWAQHAEPITFGYYAASVAQALAADGVRLQAAYRALNHSRADIGQIVPPALPFDRQRVTTLLGFDGVMTNSLYAYTSLDVELQVLAGLAIAMANLARLAENLFIWCSPEFGFAEFGLTFSGTSYAMPQKKNPYALRMIRPIAARATAAWLDAIQMFSGGLPIVGNGVIHIPNRTITCLSEISDAYDLLTAALPTLTLHRDRMRAVASDHWAQAPQLVFLLVQNHGVPFRTAHRIVAKIVHSALTEGLHPFQLLPQHVQAATCEILGRPLPIDSGALKEALDPDLVVATRIAGGPAPSAVKSHLRTLRQALRLEREWLAREKRRLIKAQRALDSAVAKLIRAAGRASAKPRKRFD